MELTGVRVREMVLQQPIRVGLVGTGFVARWRSQALLDDDRAELVAVAGRDRQRSYEFTQDWGGAPCADWQELLERPDLDLIFISSLNHHRGAIAQGALERGKHVVAEYPLALIPAQAQALLTLAQQQQRLLHIAHIELLGGLHQAFVDYLPHLGGISDVRYCTINPQRSGPSPLDLLPRAVWLPFNRGLIQTPPPHFRVGSSGVSNGSGSFLAANPHAILPGLLM